MPKKILPIHPALDRNDLSEMSLPRKNGRFYHPPHQVSFFLYRFSCNETPRFDYISPAITTLIGYSPEELYSDPSLSMRIFHPEDREHFRRILNGEKVDGSTIMRWIRKDGSQLRIEHQLIPIYDDTHQLIALEGMAHPIIRQPNQEEEAIRSITERRDHLLEISHLLSANFSIAAVIQRILQTLDSTLAYDACRLFLNEEYASLVENLENVQSVSAKSKFFPGLIHTQLPEIETVLRIGKPALVRYTPADTSHPEYEDWAVIPIYVQDNPVGAFAITRQFGPAFIQEEFEFIQLIMNYAAIAIENDILKRETRQRSEMLAQLLPFTEALNRSNKTEDVIQAIGRGAITLLHADAMMIIGPEDEDMLNPLWSYGISPLVLNELFGDDRSAEPPALYSSTQIWLPSQMFALPATSCWRILAELDRIQSAAIFPVLYEKKVLANIACFYNKPHQWTDIERETLEVFSRYAGISLENSRLYGELDETYLEAVLTLAKALDIRDTYTANHSRRLADWAEATARKFNCSPDEVKIIRWAAILHDIGKIGIPDAILRKAGPLNDEEWAVMKRHPELGAEIISPLKQLRQVTPIVRAHQERFDGTGYPDGLVGDQIPLAARILTVVDAYGAMTDERVFRKARSHEEAVAELKRCAGKQFDYRVVEAFFELINPAAAPA